ncbi:MAG: hypothetical protein V8T10_06650 [Merdibacter sp.]
MKMSDGYTFTVDLGVKEAVRPMSFLRAVDPRAARNVRLGGHFLSSGVERFCWRILTTFVAFFPCRKALW